MNDIARPLLSMTDDAASTTATKLSVQSVPRAAADLPENASDRGAGLSLTWRRLDGLASAATLGMILVSPRAALLMAGMLGPRIPPSAPAISSPNAAMRKQVDEGERPIADR